MYFLAIVVVDVVKVEVVVAVDVVKGIIVVVPIPTVERQICWKVYTSTPIDNLRPQPSFGLLRNIYLRTFIF